MPASWVVEEMKTARLNDKRLNNRLRALLSDLGAHPTASIPAACGGYAETAAAYRFFDNEKVGFNNVLQPHIDATRVRIAAQPVVVLVPDTTEVDLTRPEQQVEGAGLLDGNSRRGAFLHPMHAFTPDGTPLGTVTADCWTREEDKLPASSQTRAQRAATPIEEKESYRWLCSLRQAQAEAGRCPGTQVVFAADSEADIYEVIAAGMEEPHSIDWIVRACQDRALEDNAAGTAATPRHLRAAVTATPVRYQQTISVRGREPKVACDRRSRRQPRQSRTAVVEVRAARVTLRAPWRQDKKMPDVTVNAVLITEVAPPEGDEPVEWLLITSLPIGTDDHVRLIVEYYCVRWMIEIFFRALKSGCRVEERRFEHIDRLLPCLAVYLIVTWRTLYVCRLGRSCPEMSCEVVFDPSEWQPVYQIVRQQPPPKQPPTLQEMVRMVAQLGGYVNRKRKDEPGPQTVWLGLQRLHDIALCWITFGPGAREPEAVPDEAELV
jgi:transposase-like protein/transposase Tn5 family protein/DDE family transposase